MLQKYVFKQLIINFLSLFVLLTAIAITGIIFLFITQPGVNLILLLKMLPYLLSLISDYTIIISAVISIILTYARLSQDNEISAMLTSGVKNWKVVYPAFSWSVMLSCFCLFLNHYIIPQANYAYKTVLRESLIYLLQHPPQYPRHFKIFGYFITYESYENGTYFCPKIMVTKNNKNMLKLDAREGVVTIGEDLVPEISLKECVMSQFDEKGQIQSTTYIQEYHFRLQTEELLQPFKRYKDENYKELLQGFYNIENASRLNRLRTELHIRFVKAFMLLPLCIIAAGIGMEIKKSSRIVGLGASLPVLISYFCLLTAGKEIGERGAVSPELAAYAVGFIFTLVAAYYIIRFLRL